MKTKWILRIAALALCAAVLTSCETGPKTPPDDSLAGSISYDYTVSAKLSLNVETAYDYFGMQLSILKIDDQKVKITFPNSWYVVIDKVPVLGEPYNVRFDYTGRGEVRILQEKSFVVPDMKIEGWMRQGYLTRVPFYPSYGSEITISFKDSEDNSYIIEIRHRKN